MLNILSRASNEGNPIRRMNLFAVDGHARSAGALSEHVRRTTEIVIARGARVLRPDVETVETWICVDRARADGPRSLTRSLWPTFDIAYALRYAPLRGLDVQHLDDLVILTESLASPEVCPWYTDDRPVFANELLGFVAKCWTEACQLWQRFGHLRDSRAPWPVKLWVHGLPSQVWQITTDGALTELVDHPPVDESMVDPLPSPHSPDARFNTTPKG